MMASIDGTTTLTSLANSTYNGNSRLNNSSQHMLHTGRSIIGTTVPSALTPAVLMESTSSCCSRPCDHSRNPPVDGTIPLTAPLPTPDSTKHVDAR